MRPVGSQSRFTRPCEGLLFLLTAATDKPMEVIDGTVDELVGVGVGEKKE